MAEIDLLLLHPPSVYDFRKHAIMYGPISDMIPSSPVFEMYPLGFLTLTSYLEQRGLRVRIVNLALRMINEPDFDVPGFLAQLKPKAIGIDLHWLPHAHGSLEIARICKELHPGVPIIFGGLSSTYFHRELIEYPQVDYVMRGDSTEPPTHELLTALQHDAPLDSVPNLTWHDGQAVRVNPHSFVPRTLDYVDIDPLRIVRMVLRYRDLKSVLPFNGWWQNPIMAVFTVKGCAHGCVTCGSSNAACEIIHRRNQPVFRSPASLVKNMRAISRISRGPIFLVGDLRQAGDAHAYEVLAQLKAADLRNEIVFEFFGMPTLEFLDAIDRHVRNWSIELSPESHDEDIRRAQDDTVFYSNAEMEAVIAHALSLRCTRVDVFFMVGLPRQSAASVMATVDYCEGLFQASDARVSCFISPLGPFVDPGSRGFEQPEAHGYRLFARTLEEHRALLVQPSWRRMLNYETAWMTREELVAAVYDAGERLNALKIQYGRLPAAQGETVAAHVQRARELGARLDALEGDAAPDPEVAEALRGEIHEYSVSTICDKSELFWQPHRVNFNWLGMVWDAVGALQRRRRGAQGI